MNVLLAQAGVPYDLIADLDEINADFDTADVALIISANDVVNPVARTDKSSPIYGMAILNADKATNVIVIKRGKGRGLLRDRERALPSRQHPHAVRRCAEGGGGADPGD
jgi:NAD(P) transhydrogenase subunit beta